MITAGADGNMWFTDGGGSYGVIISSVYGGQIDRITPSGAISEYSIPSPSSDPNDIVSGPDGNLWFTAGSPHDVAPGSKNKLPKRSFTGWIGRIMPNGRVKEFAIRHLSLEIVPGPHDDMLFTQESSNEIGRITLTGKVSAISIASPGSCVVPSLRGRTLGAAMKLLSRANCKLGKVARPRSASHKLVVVGQSPAAEMKLPRGARVAVRLG